MRSSSKCVQQLNSGTKIETDTITDDGLNTTGSELDTGSLTETDTSAEGTTVASETDSGHASTTDGDTGTEWSSVTDIGFDSGSGYTGSFTEVVPLPEMSVTFGA
jgi:hypothetical protein